MGPIVLSFLCLLTFSPKGEFPQRNFARGPFWLSASILLWVIPQRRVSQKHSARNPFGLSASMLPWVIKKSPLLMTYQNDFILRTGGGIFEMASGWRAYLVSVQNLLQINIFLYVFRIQIENIYTKKNCDVKFLSEIKPLSFFFYLSLSITPLGPRASPQHEVRSSQLRDLFPLV